MKPTRDPLIELESGGLLLLQDKSFPNVVTIVTGEALAGSWWSYPRSREIFGWVNELSEHTDVLVTKLLGGKVTFVHRRLWSAFLAVASAREPCQTAGLSRAARALLNRVDGADGVLSSGPPATELERRLLVHGGQIHTESGRHRTRLETWKAWALRSGCQPSGTAALGRAILEEAVSKLGGSVRCLPWHRFPVKSSRRRTSTKGAASKR
jgi:hypothetical protein